MTNKFKFEVNNRAGALLISKTDYDGKIVKKVSFSCPQGNGELFSELFQKLKDGDNLTIIL